MFLHPPAASRLERWRLSAREEMSPAIRGLVELRVVTPSDAAYAERMRRAFDFLRTHAGHHYTSNALMAVLAAAEWNDQMSGGPPMLITAEAPFEYDPDTEVKRGGLVGVMAQLNDGSARAMSAVTSDARRMGIARSMLTLHTRTMGSPTFWVGRANRDAQLFLLQQGMSVLQMNSRGALRFGYEGEEEGSQE